MNEQRSAVEALTQIRSQADKVADTKYPYVTADWLRAVLDAVPVDATPPQGIDRKEFMATLEEIEDSDGLFDPDDLYAAVLALVRPVEGVVVPHDWVGDVVLALRYSAPTAYGGAVELRWLDIASRIEASR